MGPLLRLGVYGGIIVLVVFGPILLAMWYWSDDKISTKHWALLTGLMLAAGLMARILVISLLAGLILVAIGVAWAWHRAILADLTHKRVFLRTHLFPGEETEATWTITNDKPLPISWLRWREAVPVFPFGSRTDEGIHLEGAGIHELSGGARGLDEVTALRGYETLTRTYTVKGLRRGYYRFGPADWQASDALGLYTAEGHVPEVSALTVYPSLQTDQAFELQVRALLGDIRRRNSLVEDPTWFRGDREYRSTDSMRMIDWKATARTAILQVKSFDPTVHPKLMVLANLHAFEAITRGWITEYMEDVISTAASISRWALDAGFEVGVHSNGALPDAHVPHRILPSTGDRQLFTILDYLAKIMVIINRPVEDMLLDLNDLPHGTALVICSNVVTQGLIQALTGGRVRRDVTLILVDNEVEFKIPGVRVLHATAGEIAA
ncbi:MAG TPA: DUF58 domain-containing protein [Chloroflexota bacterium]|jgi:uncharacterized protein (DUF58 family)|nr:DUF58 domain-containing protein [Chloroflexota bacterium]